MIFFKMVVLHIIIVIIMTTSTITILTFLKIHIGNLVKFLFHKLRNNPTDNLCSPVYVSAHQFGLKVSCSSYFLPGFCFLFFIAFF